MDPPNAANHPHHVGFEAAEHNFIGNLLSLTFLDGKVPGSMFAFAIKDQTVSFGDIVALAGDFYGNWKVFGDAEQISDKWPTDPAASVKRFEENAESLATDSPGYLKKVLDIMAEERKLISDSVQAGKDPAQEYAKIADSFSIKYGVATKLAYLYISLCNFDHFGQDAIYAYRAGHTAALAQAKKAKESQLKDDLRYAYFLEGFALHFLTDLFSSGHLRPPRRILHRTLTGDEDGIFPNPWPADACAKEFHDEDCANGLFVTNSLGDSWAMYGDGQLFSAKSTGNLFRAVQASQIGVDEIWKVFMSGDDKDPGLFTALKWVADLNQLGYPTEFAPLFTFDNNTRVLSVRAKIEERANTSTRVVPQTFFGFRAALNEIEDSGTHKNRLPLTRNFPATIPVIQLQKINSDKYMANKYGPVTCLDYSLTPPADTTWWNIVSRNTPTFTPDRSNWTSPAYLSREDVLSVTGKEENEIPETGYAGYKLDFSGGISNPIERHWKLDIPSSQNTPDTAISGKLSASSETFAFTPSPPGAVAKLYVFDEGITKEPTGRATLQTTGNGLIIQEAISINEEGLPSQLLAVASVIDNGVNWSLYGWTDNYKTQLLFESREASGPIISEQWWRYLTGDLLKSGSTTQIVRLLYGENAEKDFLRVDVLEVKGVPLEVKQVWTNKYTVASWGSPGEDKYVKWLLLDVSQDGNLDIVALINTDESTLTVLVFPSLGGYSFGEPVISRINIPDSKFNPDFLKSVSVEPAGFEYPDNVRANTGILQLFDNYQVLGARLLAPDAPASLKYELKGQTPAIAGQTSIGAGPRVKSLHFDNLPGFLVSRS